MTFPDTPGPALVAGQVASWHHALSTTALPVARVVQADAERVDLLAALEALKRSISATQADLAVDLDASQRAQQAQVGVPVARRGIGVAAQVALARGESPHRGAVFLCLAKALAAELPHTRAAMRQGLIGEHAALLVAQETACLDPTDRAEVDEALCADAESLRGLGPRGLASRARAHAARLDPASVVRRARRAESERRVSLRPAPDTMTYLSGLLPVVQGVAAFAVLTRDADAARAQGDPRSRGQLMADLLVERITGQARAEAVPVAVDLVISDATLLGAGTDPAVLIDPGAAGGGGGAVPGQIARELIARAMDAETQTWVRRLYATPEGDVVAMSSRQRFVRGGLAAFLRVRDQGLCRTPWCEAPARAGDHAQDHADGGATDTENTQSLCVACNHAKQAPGWTHRPRPGPAHRPGHHMVDITTPTGHHHTARAPATPPPAAPARTSLDRILDQLIDRLTAERSRVGPPTAAQQC